MQSAPSIAALTLRNSDLPTSESFRVHPTRTLALKAQSKCGPDVIFLSTFGVSRR